MSAPGEEEVNPYQSPLADAKGSGGFTGPIPDPLMVKKFRQQIHALGALWILWGSVPIVLLAIFLAGNHDVLGLFTVGRDGPPAGSAMLVFLVGFTLVIGAVSVALGVLSCLKQMWAVYVGLVLSYASLVMYLLSLHLCGVVILIFVILQAHRVIRWSKQMTAAGVPLTAKP